MAGENLNPDPDEKKGKGEPKTVPLEALEAERRKRQDSDARAAQFEGQVQGLTAVKTEPKVDPPKELSAAELRQAVEEGKLTEDEAHAITARQIEKRVTATVTEQVRENEAALARKNLGERVSVEIERYTQAIPDLADQSSAAFQKVRTEYQWLVSHGSTANDPQTELMAVRVAFGDIDKLQKIKPGQRETHQETGGHSEPGGPTDHGDGSPKDMPADTRRYYQDQINQGVVADWKAAKDEWSYKPKHAPRARTA